MASILESLMGMLGGDTLSKISEQVGAPKNKTEQALPDIMAVLTGALAKNSSQQEGAQALSDALAKDHDGSILNNLSDYISNYPSGSGNGILSHVLGDNRSAVEQGLSKKSGLDIGTIGNLLTMAAPLIMGALGKTQRQDSLNASGLSNLLGTEQNQAQSLAPGALGILNQIMGAGSSSGQSSQTTGSSRKGCLPVIIIIIVSVLAVILFFLFGSGLIS